MTSNTKVLFRIKTALRDIAAKKQKILDSMTFFMFRKLVITNRGGEGKEKEGRWSEIRFATTYNSHEIKKKQPNKLAVSWFKS